MQYKTLLALFTSIPLLLASQFSRAHEVGFLHHHSEIFAATAALLAVAIVILCVLKPKRPGG